MHIGAAEIFSGDFLAGRGLHQRRAAQEDRARAFDDDRFVAHRGHIRAAGGAGAHHHRDLRNAFRGHPCLVEEDAAEVLAIGKHVRLHRQKRAARIDQVNAGQVIVQRHFLRAQVLLDGERVVGAALDRRVIGDDQHVATGDPADAGHDAGARRVTVVHVPGGERRELEKRGAGIDQSLDALAHRHLALLAVPRKILWAAALANLIEAAAILGDQRLHALAIGAELGAVDVDLRMKSIHYQPQHSVLKRQRGGKKVHPPRHYKRTRWSPQFSRESKPASHLIDDEPQRDDRDGNTQ